jgi:hypothetical protein
MQGAHCVHVLALDASVAKLAGIAQRESNPQSPGPTRPA